LWTRLRAVATLLKSGGLVVITPPGAGEDDSADVRSLIQFDGDMVTSVVAARLGDREILEQHFARVRALLADLDRLRKQLLTFVVVVILLVPSLWSVGSLFASAGWDWAAICWALALHVASSGVIASVVVAARRWILGRALGWGREEFGVSVRDRLFPDEAARLF
jgi:hypothetical protein